MADNLTKLKEGSKLEIRMFVEPKKIVAQGMRTQMKPSNVLVKKSPRTNDQEYVAKEVTNLLNMSLLKRINA